MVRGTEGPWAEMRKLVGVTEGQKGLWPQR